MTDTRRQRTVTNDAELLARLISGNGEKKGHDLTDRLLARFGGLRQLLHTDAKSLMAVHGVGAARSAAIRALPELARRYYEDSLPPGETIRSPADTEAYLQARLRHLGHELFCCLYLDNRHRVLRFDEMFRGTIDGVRQSGPTGDPGGRRRTGRCGDGSRRRTRRRIATGKRQETLNHCDPNPVVMT